MKGDKPTICILDTLPLPPEMFVKVMEDSPGFGLDLSNSVVYPTTAPDQIYERARGHRFVGLNKTIIDAKMARKLHEEGTRHYVEAATGVDNLDLQAITELGDTVSNVPEYATYDVAQMTIALAHDLCRGITTLDRAVGNGEWVRSFSIRKGRSRRMRGLTMGVIGVGRIGAEVARMSIANEMNVIGCDPQMQKLHPDDPPHGIQWCSMEELLTQSDIISLHMPGLLNDKSVLGYYEFDLIHHAGRRPDLINTSRGNNIKRPALLNALRKGWVNCAALDVMPRGQEPPTDPELLLFIDEIRTKWNCIVTPHGSFLTDESGESLIGIFVDNISSIMQGCPQNLVLPAPIVG